ncbi:ABC transporter permease [Candidatus Hydrogenedentota bacterium]
MNILSATKYLSVDFPMFALIRRELLRNLRTVSAFVCLVIYVGICTYTAIAIWPESGSYMATSNAAKHLVMTLSGVMYAFCLLLVPTIASRAIVVEKEQDTYDLLRLTLISSYGLLVGKILNTLGSYLLFIIAAMPFFALGFFVVGFDWVQLTQLFGLIIATTISCGGIGVLCSAICKRSFSALVASYFLTIFVVQFRPFFFIMPIMLFSRGASYQWLAPVLSPMMALVSIGQGGLSWWQYACAIAVQFAITAFCCLIAAQVIKRPPKAKNVTPIGDAVTLKKRRRHFPFYLVDPLARKRTVKFGRFPMITKEYLAGSIRWFSPAVRLSLYVFIIWAMIMGVTIFYRGWGNYYWGADEFVTRIILLILTIPILTANLLTREYELHNIEMLRMTLLKPHQVMVGKFWAAWVSLSPVLLLILLSCIPFFASRNTGEFWEFVLGILAVLQCAFIAINIVLFASVLVKKTSTAVILSYVLGFMVFAGGIIMLGALAVTFRSLRLLSYDDFFFLASPIATFYIGAREEWHNLWLGSYLAFALLGYGFLYVATMLYARQMRQK